MIHWVLTIMVTAGLVTSSVAADRDQTDPSCDTTGYYQAALTPWSVPDIYGAQAMAQKVDLPLSTAGMRILDISWYLYHNGDSLIYTTNSKVTIYTDNDGVPGDEVASVVVTPTDYVFYPQPMVVRFDTMDVTIYYSDFWVAIEPDSTATPATGIRVITDQGGCGYDRCGGQWRNNGWEIICDIWGGPCDLAFVVDIGHCWMVGGYWCGDIDTNWQPTDVGDLTYLVAYLFQGGPAPVRLEVADVDGSGGVDVGDLTYLVAYLFQGGTSPQCW